MHTAEQHKVTLLKWLMPELAQSEIVCAELPFLDERNKADIALVSPTRLAAFEIKSGRDNTETIEKQILNYKRMFLESWVATTTRHMKAVRSKVGKNIGLILLDDKSTLKVIRRARQRKLLTPDAAVRWLNSLELALLARQLGLPVQRRAGVEALREQLAKTIERRTLSSYAIAAVHKRHLETFQYFSDERGETITLDDARLLSLASRLRVVNS